uniref:Single domain-containing protein n=1 Tax=Amblyomma maculatum TaxID=34609 RepID=G3MNU9_AMBMU
MSMLVALLCTLASFTLIICGTPDVVGRTYVVKNVKVINGSCIYVGNQIPDGEQKSLHYPCENVTCNAEEREVTAVMCKDFGVGDGCTLKLINEGVFPACCPRQECPDGKKTV